MTHDPEETFQIVMRKVPEPDQPDAAMFLSGCFSLPPASTRNIAASAPIALLADLGKGQAEAIVAELRPALPAGVHLEILPADDTLARLQWPRPPRIYGKDADDFTPPPAEEPHDIKCPLCGGMLHIVNENGELKVERQRSDTGVTPAPAPANDKDPLFSGIKPLATANTKYASLRSLQAGDTGFWMDNKTLFPTGSGPLPLNPPPARNAPVPGETSHSRRMRPAAGLAAFMKPGAFSIVVARTRDPQAVKMIAEIMGISEPEARDKCLALSLTPARAISLDEAQSLLARLQNLGARARIVKPA